MQITSLKRRHGLIVVAARIWGRRGSGFIALALDTAATETLIKPTVLSRFGYRDEDAEETTAIHSAIGVERGYLLRVERMWALGFSVGAHVVHAHDLPGHYDIDGLLGLRFLDRFDYTIRSRRHEIAVDFAAP